MNPDTKYRVYLDDLDAPQLERLGIIGRMASSGPDAYVTLSMKQLTQLGLIPEQWQRTYQSNRSDRC